METLALHSPSEWLALITLLAALGGAAGFMAGLFGVGGGVILVPGIFYVFRFLDFPPDQLMHLAVGTSLAVIVPTGFSSALAHHKKGGVRFDLLKMIGIGVVIGVVIGTITADRLSGESMKLIFACAIICLAMIMIADPSRFKIFSGMPPAPIPAFAGGFIGFISTLIGIGGATLSVPFMTMCKVPIRQAIGTASALGLTISVPAAPGFILIGLGEPGLPPLSLGYVNLPAWAVIVPASVLAAPWGAWAAHKIPVPMMRKVFAAFMVVIALHLAVEMM